MQSLVTCVSDNGDHWMMTARAVLVCGFATGVGTVVMLQNNSGDWVAGDSAGVVLAFLLSGWIAITVGVVMSRRRPESNFGLVLAVAGFAWFIAGWNNPGAGSSVVFTIGLVFYAVGLPLVAHAALSYPGGRLGNRLELGALVVTYGGAVVLLGVGQALVFDPTEQGCGFCPDNLLSVASAPEVVASFNRAGMWIVLSGAVVLALLAGWRLISSTPAARRGKAPVLLPAIAFLGAGAASYGHSLSRGTLANDAFDRLMWQVQAAALALLALGVAFGWVRARRARSAVAELVVDLSESPPQGGLRDSLAGTLGDPGLVVGYPIGDGRHVDARGDPVELATSAGQATTAVLHADETIALLRHRADLLGDPRLVQEVVSAAGLAFQNERLQAVARAQLDEVRTSRTRLVAVSDGERRRLERDLHDGAQQSLIGLMLALRLMWSRIDPDGDLATAVTEAETEMRRAVDELRELASGIHPAVLSDLGLAAAIESLAEGATSRISLVRAPEVRLSPAVETAAYLVVAEAAKVGTVTVNAVRTGGMLVVDIDGIGAPARFVDLQDRVGALDGTLTVEPAPGAGGVRIRAEIPCA